MSVAFEKATAAFRAVRTAPGFDQRMFDAYERDKFAEHFGITSEQMLEIIKASCPKVTADRFEWLEAVVSATGQGRITQKGLIVACVLFAHFNDASPYAWPSQQTIASRAGWTGTRAVKYGLAQLVELGAIEKIAAKNLPVEIAQKVLSAKSDGGSGRDVRSVTYKRLALTEWKNGKGCTDYSPIKVNGSFPLNLKGKPQPASQEASTYYHSSDTSQNVETYIPGTDRDGLDSTWGITNV